MVSLAFIISFVVSAVAMLIGVIIYSDMAEAMEQTFVEEVLIVDTFKIVDTLALAGSGQSIQEQTGGSGDSITGQRITLIDEKVSRVNLAFGQRYIGSGNVEVQIRTGATGTSFGTIVDTSNEKYSITGLTTIQEFEFTFPTKPVLNEEVVIIGVIVDSSLGGVTIPMQADPSVFNCVGFTQWCPNTFTYPEGVQRGEFTTKSNINAWSSGGSGKDAPIKIWVEEESLVDQVVLPDEFAQAENIALTVLGVLPVALFFGLFTILSPRVDGGE